MLKFLHQVIQLIVVTFLLQHLFDRLSFSTQPVEVLPIHVLHLCQCLLWGSAKTYMPQYIYTNICVYQLALLQTVEVLARRCELSS